jgi:Pilus formation protein N terminal region
MSSRLWLAVAFVLASGASPARAETPMIAVTLDQAKVVKLPREVMTIIVGNPMIADVTKLKNNDAMVITGKGYGETNLIALGADGSTISEIKLRVVSSQTVVIFQSGDSRVSYACNPNCMPTVQLGDDKDHFEKAGAEITLRDSLAQGTGSASMSGGGR